MFPIFYRELLSAISTYLMPSRICNALTKSTLLRNLGSFSRDEMINRWNDQTIEVDEFDATMQLTSTFILITCKMVQNIHQIVWFRLLLPLGRDFLISYSPRYWTMQLFQSLTQFKLKFSEQSRVALLVQRIRYYLL